MTNHLYLGLELDVFAFASNWKSYYRELTDIYIGREVLEVGAGIGSTTKALCNGSQERWICLEPNPLLINKITARIEKKELPSCCAAKNGTIFNITESDKFDSILYIDVLEHIKEDQKELERVTHFLKEDGYLIILSPAHQFLYTPFDAEIGHCRRYTKKSLSAIIPKNVSLCKLIYVDSLGVIALMSNRFIFKNTYPTINQILFWDRVIIPFSRFLDPILKYSLGKSIIGIWQKKNTICLT